ncbi:uncharacterized protein PHACADRAFT_262179 [Phanerochaete carnosa HHB-10118-sp]|uniref:MARVEL domain-containing protein n=1 Tax=Phanerochaete carnosa (strain HHB-10118-sp) TaxID=650164 RepID=K5WNF1_PHACS|nr:uncharacterized protein PHACADRAFT_262179 [Phanerochaete carnosa HHB-10118-sp]EKM51817.1 hypothetical protein PHACADRAFT_262179 [Phanerochaete carnosa HHB-10118-sp]
MTPISRYGKKLLAAYCALALLDSTVLALATRVNIWQQFFFVADMFPLGLSIASLVLILLMFLSSVTFPSSFLARPAAQIGIFSFLSVLWLASNAFSTSRWGGIPMPCSSVPQDYPDVRTWCQDAQALKFFIWILFAGMFCTTLSVTRYVVAQHRHGNRHVWRVALARFDPRSSIDFGHVRSPSVFGGRATMTDYFGRANGTFRPGTDSKW